MTERDIKLTRFYLKNLGHKTAIDNYSKSQTIF